MGDLLEEIKSLLEDWWAEISEFFVDIEDKIEDIFDWIGEKLGK
tara:strand:+ start:609 stop:740 length:132 start_codon:yes stop_codon:yes gene_type:complete